MKIIETDIPDVKIIEPLVFADSRGYFFETWSAPRFAAAGLDWKFVQDNHSRSRKNVLRGLHFQIDNAQDKLVCVVSGAVFDVAVDLRRSSVTFGKWIGAELSEANHRMLWVPQGFAHGFLALQDDTHLLYKCTDTYSAKSERTILWNDPAIGIKWPLSGQAPLLSDKDAVGVLFKDSESYQ